MKFLKYINILAIGAIGLASCDNLNEAPEFNDKDAFVAFTSPSMSIAENKGTLKVPVLLSSLSGLSSTVSYVVKDNGKDKEATATQGKEFDVLGTGTLTLTKEAPQGFIEISLLDNDTYGGDKVFVLELSNAGDVNMGAVSRCVVKIEDDEHPLAFILGSFSATGVSDFNGPEAWTIKVEKDAGDVTKIWISNLVLGGSGEKVYGVVNAEKNLLQIPVGQVILKSSSYPKILLEGFYGPDGDDAIPTGGKITADIGPDGTITFKDWFGSHVYTDEGGTVSAGWYNIFATCIMKKN